MSEIVCVCVRERERERENVYTLIHRELQLLKKVTTPLSLRLHHFIVEHCVFLTSEPPLTEQHLKGCCIVKFDT